MRCIPDEIDKVLSVTAVIAARNLRTVVRGKTIFHLGGFAHSRKIPILRPRWRSGIIDWFLKSTRVQMSRCIIACGYQSRRYENRVSQFSWSRAAMLRENEMKLRLKIHLYIFAQLHHNSRNAICIFWANLIFGIIESKIVFGKKR